VTAEEPVVLDPTTHEVPAAGEAGVAREALRAEEAPDVATDGEVPTVEVPAPDDTPTAEARPEEPIVESAPAEPVADAPPAEPVADAPPVEDTDVAATGPPDLSTGRDQARLAAAIERVGGPQAIREALQPKRDEAGKPLKWAAVCCEAAQGLKPGDPVFAAWVRLAATPVRELKSRVPDDRPDRGRGGGRGGGGRGDERGGGQRGGGQRGGRRDDRDTSGRASREDMQKHAFGGRVGAKIVIPGFDPPTDD